MNQTTTGTDDRFAERWARRVLAAADGRQREYRAAIRFLTECPRVLDVACGTGTFLALRRGSAIGIDINPDNIAFCREQGLDAVVGNALELPFEPASFDGIHCSHLLQVFSPGEAVQAIREMGRVVKPGGVIVLTTLNWFTRFFRHPENVRPYPPDAIRRLFGKQRGAQSPMFPNLPDITMEDIWLRRPPLWEFHGVVSRRRERIASLLNAIQSAVGMRNPWRFDAYVAKLRVGG